MNYIINRDYKVVIRKEVEAIVSRSDNSVKQDAELTAVSLASGYLANRYDVTKIFKDITTHSTSAQYNEGDWVTDSAEQGTDTDYTSSIYQCLTSTSGDNLSNATFWKKEDPRNKALVSRIVDIALYEMHCAINPRNIPELRMERYNAAIKWLEKLSKGAIVLNLPLIKDADGNDIEIFTGGSNPKTSTRW